MATNIEPLEADSEHPIELIVASRISKGVTYAGAEADVSLTTHGAQYMKLMRFIFSELICVAAADPKPPAEEYMKLMMLAFSELMRAATAEPKLPTEDVVMSLFNAPGAVLSSKARFAMLGLQGPVTFKIARKGYRVLLAAMEEHSASQTSMGMPAFVFLNAYKRLKK